MSYPPRASEHRVSQYTPAHLALMQALSRRGIPYLSEQSFLRAGEMTRDGRPKSFTVDLLFPDPRLVVEVEGAGSASADHPARDAFFGSLGYRVLHIANRDALRHTGEAVDHIHTVIKELEHMQQLNSNESSDGVDAA